jgi:outer membrane protein, heavy metal efflux system
MIAPEPLTAPLSPHQCHSQLRAGWSLLALFAVTGFTACTRYSPRPLSATTSAESFDARRLDSPEMLARLDAAGIPLMGVWNLAQLTEAACWLNPELIVLRARVETVASAMVTAGERPNPVLWLRPAYNSSLRGASPWIIEPWVDITIETGGKREVRIAEATARLRTVVLEREAAVWRIRGEIRRALIAIASASAITSVATAQASNLAVIQQRVQDRVAVGAIPDQDASTARIGVEQARLAVLDADLQSIRARALLAAAIGIPVAALEGVPLNLLDALQIPEAPPPAELRRKALSHRVDILAALADYAANEERLRLEVARQYPDLRLGPGYKLDQGIQRWMLGIGFEVPILNQRRGPIAEADGRRAEASARFNSVQARAIAEIDLAHESFRAARSRAGSAGRIRDELRTLVSATESMLAAGEVSELEVLQRRADQFVAEVSAQQALLQAAAAASSLEDALQTPIPFWK